MYTYTTSKIGSLQTIMAALPSRSSIIVYQLALNIMCVHTLRHISMHTIVSNRRSLTLKSSKDSLPRGTFNFVRFGPRKGRAAGSSNIKRWARTRSAGGCRRLPASVSARCRSAPRSTPVGALLSNLFIFRL